MIAWRLARAAVRYPSCDEPLRRVAVLGAGTMGSRIAAHLANAGFPVDLLDIVLPESAEAESGGAAGIEGASKQRPVAFMTESAKSLITPGNFEDDLGPSQTASGSSKPWRRICRLSATCGIASLDFGSPVDPFHQYQRHSVGSDRGQVR